MEQQSHKRNSLHSRRVNLDYEEVTPYLLDMSPNWQKMLNTPNRENVGFPTDFLQSIIHRGVPRQLRGGIWQLLMEQHRLRNTRATRKPTSNVPYNDLLKQLTSQQHVQMYQLSRLLHDQHRDLHDHLEALDIGPSLYAAPWFLTLFSSQFPLGFVARIFDLIFFKGPEVVFKVALSLLGIHKNLIMRTCNSFETVVDFLKSTLPKLSIVQLEKTINQVIDMDLSKQLHAYEVEYHVLQDVAEETLPAAESDRLLALERTTTHLRQQNLDLLEELQVYNSDDEANLIDYLSPYKYLFAVELERLALLNTVQDLRNKLATAHQENLHLNGPFHAWPGS
uniref:Rab-GAP TBC domain-containing protein n=1 Tax=Eptatretus burgeri TaxID=7764 RepID=A0A8C4Q7N6_EPTBU